MAVRTSYSLLTVTSTHYVLYSEGAPGMMGTATLGTSTLVSTKATLITTISTSASTISSGFRSAVSTQTTFKTSTAQIAPEPTAAESSVEMQAETQTSSSVSKGLKIGLPVGLAILLLLVVLMIWRKRRHIRKSVAEHSMGRPLTDESSAAASPSQSGKSSPSSTPTQQFLIDVFWPFEEGHPFAELPTEAEGTPTSDPRSTHELEACCKRSEFLKIGWTE